MTTSGSETGSEWDAPASEITLVGTSGNTAVQIGPNAQLIFYDMNGNVEAVFDGTGNFPFFLFGENTGQQIEIVTSNGIGILRFLPNPTDTTSNSAAEIDIGIINLGGLNHLVLDVIGPDANGTGHMAMYFSSGSDDGTSPAPFAAVQYTISGVSTDVFKFDANTDAQALNNITKIGEVWHDLSFLNGFSAGSQAGWHSGIRYRKTPSDGMVQFDGIVACPASPGGKIMAQFPVGYRPSSFQQYWCICPANSPKLTDIEIGADGNITFLTDIGNPAGTGNIYLTGQFFTT